MVDFLWEPSNAQPDDVLATDYFPESANWKAVRPSKTPVILQAENRVNKLVAHRSYRRPSLSPNWDLSQRISDLDPALGAFCHAILHHRKAWFPYLALRNG